MRQGAKEGDAFSDEDRNPRHDETLNLPSPKEFLDGDTTINVQVHSASPGETTNKFVRCA
jgi:hypothetical protein